MAGSQYYGESDKRGDPINYTLKNHTTIFHPKLFYDSVPGDFHMNDALIAIFVEFNDRITPAQVRVDMR
jgi:hypothetical protein